MKSLFDSGTRSEIQSRIGNLTSTIAPAWGKMSVGQMCTHCQMPLEVAMNQRELQSKKPGFLKSMLFKMYKPLMYNDKPWRKNLPTVPDFIVAEDQNFENEREKLSGLVDEFHNQRELSDFPPHPMFGNFTKEQWGKMQYKHLDHHLKQFGV